LILNESIEVITPTLNIAYMERL